MALEPSEVFCAAAMCFTEKALDDFTSEKERYREIQRSGRSYSQTIPAASFGDKCPP